MAHPLEVQRSRRASREGLTELCRRRCRILSASACAEQCFRSTAAFRTGRATPWFSLSLGYMQYEGENPPSVSPGSRWLRMIVRFALVRGRQFSGGPLKRTRIPQEGQSHGRISTQVRLTVPHFSTVLYDWTATLNDPYQHHDKRQHKKNVDKAA